MLTKIFLRLYDLFWMLALPVVWGYLWWRGSYAPAYRQGLRQRLGLIEHRSTVDIWLHAVSVGEVMAARPLVEAWLSQGKKVLITCMTPTGAEQIQRSFGTRVLQQYCPYDLSWARRRFLQVYQPKIWVIMETELWPGWLYAVAQAKIPIFLINGRISNRSYPRYCRSKILWSKLLSQFTRIYVQTLQDEQRFLAIGAEPSKVEVAGNLKFHQAQVPAKVSYWQGLKPLFADRQILVFGSTHAGEEAMILSALKGLEKCFPQVLAMIVPRHPERFNEVLHLVQDQGFNVQLFSSWLEHPAASLDVLVIDRMGELSSLYAIALLAFVGGSLVPVGGHNILEPMYYGVPVLCGPYMHNQQSFMALFESKNAIIKVKNADDLGLQMKYLLSDLAAGKSLVKASFRIIQENQRALEICVKGIEAYAQL